MLSTIDDFIKAKGIMPNSIYTIGAIASMLGLHYRTVQGYRYIGCKAADNGTVRLQAFRSGQRWEVIGRDLIEFLKQVNGNGN